MRGTRLHLGAEEGLWGEQQTGTGTPACAGGYGVALLLLEALKWVPGMLRGGDISNHST